MPNWVREGINGSAELAEVPSPTKNREFGCYPVSVFYPVTRNAFHLITTRSKRPPI